MKGIVLLCKLQSAWSRLALITIYKCFIRPHREYVDVIYDQVSNKSFIRKIDSIQRNTALDVINSIKVSSHENWIRHLRLNICFREDRWDFCGYVIKFFQLHKQPAYIRELLSSMRTSSQHPYKYIERLLLCNWLLQERSVISECYDCYVFLSVIPDWN